MRAQMKHLFGRYDAAGGYYRASGGHYAERPRDADAYAHAVAHGDVLVLATDGVWDNLSVQDVLRAVCREPCCWRGARGARARGRGRRRRAESP